MAFSFTITKQGVMGDLAYVIGTWDATGVTSGSIVTGLAAIESSNVVNKTAVRASQTQDDTSTAGQIDIGGVTSGDAGEFIAFGRA